MVEKLNAIGKPISWERVLEIAGEASVGRPHVAQALVEAGHVASIPEAFDLYIGRDGPAYAEREKMTPIEAIETLHRYGAPAVMAHPSYTKSVDDVLPELVGAWPRRHGGLLPRLRRGDGGEARRKAKELGILPLGGSDYHALDNPGEREPGRIPLPDRIAKDFLEKELPWVPTGALG